MNFNPNDSTEPQDNNTGTGEGVEGIRYQSVYSQY